MGVQAFEPCPPPSLQAMKAALRKIKEAEMMQSKMSTISSSMDFLTRVYIGNKDGDSYGVHVSTIF